MTTLRIALPPSFRFSAAVESHGWFHLAPFHGRAVSDQRMVRVYRKWGHWQYLAYWAELWRE
jgi:hypothetical protein